MCGTVAWLQVKPVEMMSNSTLPLGFFHSNTELVTCGQLLYFPILGQRKLSRVFHSGCSYFSYFHIKLQSYYFFREKDESEEEIHK